MNLSPLRQMFSEVADRAAQLYKQAIPLSGQQTVNSLKQFLTPSFTNSTSLKQNDIALQHLSQKFTNGSTNLTRKSQTDDKATFKQILSKLPPETQKKIIEIAPNVLNDKDFKELFNIAVKDPKFSKLNVQNQLMILGNLDSITATGNYQKMSSSERICSLSIIKDMSFYVAEHPYDMAKNTLFQLAMGKVKVGIRNLSNTESNNTLGSYNTKTNTIYFNVGNQTLLKNPQQLMKAAAHEINHALNGDKAADRVEKFLDEYRAYYVEGAAIGQYPPGFATMKERLNTLLLKKPYEFHKEYGTDTGFQKVINSVIADYDKGKITTPEELRQRLRALPGKEKSIYLNTKPNLDNH